MDRTISAPVRRRQFHPWLQFLCGCGFALIFLELLLHPFSGKFENGQGFEQRNDREGIATAHFSADGLRLTGNPQIPGAPRVLILGDSHVEAFNVADEQTMGSVLERRLRDAGMQWNVLQYGWSGADGPDYVYSAPVIDGFHPIQVFLVLNWGDFTAKTADVRLVELGSKVVAEAIRPGFRGGRPPSYGGAISRKLKESALFYSSAVRLDLDVIPALSGNNGTAYDTDLSLKTASESNVELVVRGVKEAYGNRLWILYTPKQPFSEDDPAEPQEGMLLAECKRYGIACRSLRGRMLRQLLEKHELSRGFTNTEPGEGHLNACGHEVAAEEMYDRMRARN